LFCLSAAAMLGLGALLASSEILFNAVKIIGAGYLFYLGVKQLFKCGRLAASCTSRRS
jgi:threonine/homoserine/homoserine lactone efflux protein